MKNLRKIGAAFTVSAGLILGGTVSAQAVTEYVGGETWDYGVNYWTMTTWSNYHHTKVVHGSTACSLHKCASSKRTPKNLWSKASVTATWGGNTAYWNK